MSLENILVFHLFIINVQVCDCEAIKVQKELSILELPVGQIEVDECTSEIVVSFLQGQLERVLHILQKLRSLLRLSLSQLTSRFVLRVDEEVIAEMLKHQCAFGVTEFEGVRFFGCFYHLKFDTSFKDTNYE